MRLSTNAYYSPKTVISMVGPSRSGSSAIKYAVALHPELTSLAGEEEPYYKLAHNGYPWHESDAFDGGSLNMACVVRMCIANEVCGFSQEHNREWLQQNLIEEPPFVHVNQDMRITETLLLKTPQNCYRRGVMEELYPMADVRYIVTRRDRYAVINGLMDGWLSDHFSARQIPQGFYTCDTPHHLLPSGRSQRRTKRTWWKFDMPPGWQSTLVGRAMSGDPFDSFVELHDLCAHQYSQASLACVYSYPDAITVEYEQFLEDWRGVTYDIWDQLGLDKYDLSGHNLPVVMATDQPKKDRWKEKRPWLVDVC